MTSSDKLLRLQSELLSSLELAKQVLNRENLKREVAHQSQQVWDKRLALVDLKRKFPSLGVKEDEELLHDKERVPKRLKTDPGAGYVLVNVAARCSGTYLLQLANCRGLGSEHTAMLHHKPKWKPLFARESGLL